MPAATCTHCHRPATRNLRGGNGPTCDEHTPELLETSIEMVAPQDSRDLTYLAVAHLAGKRIWERRATTADAAHALADAAEATFFHHRVRRGLSARHAAKYLS